VFTEFGGAAIRRITAGAISEYPLPARSYPIGITVGPDGALWFTESENAIRNRTHHDGRSDHFISFTALHRGHLALVYFRRAGWGVVVHFAISHPQHRPHHYDGHNHLVPLPSASDPLLIVPGPDGTLWFPDFYGDKIGRITTTRVITEYAVPTYESGPNGIASGTDGALWFTEYSGNTIGRITTSGAITEFPFPAAVVSPSRLQRGPTARCGLLKL